MLFASFRKTAPSYKLCKVSLGKLPHGLLVESTTVKSDLCCQIFHTAVVIMVYTSITNGGLTKRNKDSQRFPGCLLHGYLKGTPCYCTVAHGTNKISLTTAQVAVTILQNRKLNKKNN